MTVEGSRWGGVFPIPVTPFYRDLSVDIEGLRSEVRFCVESGAHGIVYPGVVSEFFTLSEAERLDCLKAVIEEVRGRIPVIAGVSSTSAPVAASLTRSACEVGANGYMATLPYVQHFFAPDLEYAVQYFEGIAAAGSGKPIILQNARIGYPMPLRLIPTLVARVPAIRYLKQETSPPTHELSAAIAMTRDVVEGVFGGLGGIYLLSELDRGAAGSMPAPPFVDVLVQVWNSAIAGNRDRARTLLAKLGSLFTYELMYNVAVIKEVLKRRGVIEQTSCRVPVPHLDEVDLRELDELLAHAGIVG